MTHRGRVVAPLASPTLASSSVWRVLCLPSSQGYKSLNVSIRKTLGLYANVRPTVSLTPFVQGKANVDLICVRENEEDTYAGIEHQQTPEVVQCLKLVSRPGCERIVRYAFDYAVANNRKRVTAFHKANIMKITDGMFLDVAREIYAAEYDGMFKFDDIIVDIGTALLADTPEKFDVLVMPNLYGDIASDVIAQVVGSVGLGGSANIGETVSMFEAIHGSAPDIAGKKMANPSGLLLGAVQMLQHVGHPAEAAAIQNAWLKTIEDGIHTGDIYTEGTGYSKQLANTDEFTDAIIERLGQVPTSLPVADFSSKVETPTLAGSAQAQAERKRYHAPQAVRELHGVDVFAFMDKRDPDALAAALHEATKDVEGLELRLITNRGVKVWPNGLPETFMTDHWRCRFRPTEGPEGVVDASAVLDVINKVSRAGIEVIKTENLFLFDGQPGFSLGQGE